MKKNVVFLLALMMIFTFGCSSIEEEKSNVLSESIMVDGEIYISTGEEIPIEPAEGSIKRVTSVSKGTTLPNIEGQINFPLPDSKYAKIDDGEEYVVILIESEWVKFAKEKSNETSKNIMSSTADTLGITHENYPRIDGSSSTLGIVEGINRAMYVDSCKNDNWPEAASKTVPSYKLLINDEVDMIFVPYASFDILKLAEDSGVKLEFIPIASEALIFITPVENGVENITMEQIREIYLNYGIKSWSELGGVDRELVPICRNADSGSQSQMDNLILEGKKMHSDIEENYVELTMEGMLEQVAFYHNGGLDGSPTQSYALGYTLYTYLKNIGYITGIDEELKILAFDGVIPSEKSIADSSYPLADSYYAVVRSDLPEEHSARRVIDWLKSYEGKAIIKKIGLIIKE